ICGYLRDSLSIAGKTIAVAIGSVVPMRISPLVGSERKSMSCTPCRRSLKTATLRFASRKTVWRRHDAAPAAVQESNAERIFQLDDRLGNSGLGDVETLRRLSHAPGFNDGQQDIEVTQFQPTLGAMVPRHESHSYQTVMR